MTQSLEDCIPQIAAVVVAVSGVKGLGLPRENSSEYPFAMTYIFDGEIGGDIEGQSVGLYNIAIDLLAPFERGLANILPTLHPILDDLQNDLLAEVKSGGGQFSNTVDTFSNLRLFFLPDYPYGAIQLIGYRVIMEGVKILTVLS